jgi:hypothetical protein
MKLTWKRFYPAAAAVAAVHDNDDDVTVSAFLGLRNIPIF